MAVSVCPADRVAAPAERVWELLTDPAGYGRFWDLTVDRVEPAGPAAVGQKFFARTRALGRWFRVEGEVVEVDAGRHAVAFRTSLPFGLVGHNRISCTPIDAASCVLRFG